MWGIATFFKGSLLKKDPAPAALAEARETRVPPGPNLQANPSADMAAFRAAEQTELATWAWVDREKGVARVPGPARDGDRPLPRSPRAAPDAAPGSCRRGPPMSRVSLPAVALLGLLLGSAQPLAAIGTTDPHLPEAPLPPPPVKDVGFDQKLGESIPLDLVFKDEAGKDVRLSQYFGKRPVVLSLVYFNCPMLCGMTTDGLVRSVRALRFEPGDRLRDPLGQLRPARDARDGVREEAHRDVAVRPEERPWRLAFPDGRRRLGRGAHEGRRIPLRVGRRTEAVRPRDRDDLLTPQGRIARYFFGIEYPAKDLRLALIEASEEKIGNVVDQLLLLCYHYDPKAGRYTATVRNLVRGGAVLTLVALAGFVTIMLWRERAGAARPPR